MSTSVSSVVSHFPSPQNGFTTTLASTIASGAATVPLNSVAGYTNGQVFVGVVEPTSTTAKQTFTGIVDTAGVQITSVVWTAGTNQTHNAGSTVVDYATATHIAMMTKGILVDHTQKGRHKTLFDDNANEWVEQGSTASAVNQVKITNAVTANAPIISSNGDDTNIDLTLSTKGTGAVNISSTATSTSGINPSALFDSSDRITDHVVAGTGVVAISSGLTGTFSNITYYIGGKRYTASSIANNTYTASRDTYVDINTSGTVSYTSVANNATSPALAANSVRVAIVVTSGAAITVINQGSTAATGPTVSSCVLTVCDSLGNLIYPTSASPKGIIGYRKSTTNSGAQASGYVVPGLSMPIVVPTGARVKLHAKMNMQQSVATTSAFVTTNIRESASIIIQGYGQIQGSNGYSNQADAIAEDIVTPTAGLHTYDVTAGIGNGSVVVTGAAATASVIWAELV